MFKTPDRINTFYITMKMHLKNNIINEVIIIQLTEMCEVIFKFMNQFEK